MNCIYQKDTLAPAPGDVASIIPEMFTLIKNANSDDYAHATFPRAYCSDVFDVLGKFKFKLVKDPSISCELHVVNNRIHLEFVKQ